MVKPEKEPVTGRKRILIPATMVAWIDSRARKLGLTREEYVDRILDQAIKRHQALEDELTFREGKGIPKKIEEASA